MTPSTVTFVGGRLAARKYEGDPPLELRTLWQRKSGKWDFRYMTEEEEVLESKVPAVIELYILDWEKRAYNFHSFNIVRKIETATS